MKYKTEVKTYALKVADITAKVINQPETVFNMLKDDFNPIQEEMYILILNNRNKVIEKHLVSKGASGSTVITPAEILRLIFLTNGNKFIIAHNHPSEDCSPSAEDINFTTKIGESAEICGLHLLDHIIYSSTSFKSLKQMGVM